MFLLPLLFPLRSRLSEAFSHGDCLPLRAVLHLNLLFRYLEPPLVPAYGFMHQTARLPMHSVAVVNGVADRM